MKVVCKDEDLDEEEIKDEIMEEVMEVSNKYSDYISELKITWKEKEIGEEKQDE